MCALPCSKVYIAVLTKSTQEQTQDSVALFWVQVSSRSISHCFATHVLLSCRQEITVALEMIQLGQLAADTYIFGATDSFGFEERIPLVYLVVKQYCAKPRALRELLLAMLERGADPDAFNSPSNPNPGATGSDRPKHKLPINTDILASWLTSSGTYLVYRPIRTSLRHTVIRCGNRSGTCCSRGNGFTRTPPELFIGASPPCRRRWDWHKFVARKGWE